MRLRLLSLAAFALSAATWGQGLSTKVTLTVKGEPASQAISELGQKGGMYLEAGAPTANDVLVLSLNGVPLIDAMKRIAAAEDAEWVRNGSGFRLTRSSASVRGEQDREDKLRLANLTRALDEQRKTLAGLPAFDAKEADKLAGRLESVIRAFRPEGNSWQDVSKIAEEGPASRAIDKIMLNISPSEFLGLPEKIKVVYSNKPTATELPMPVDVSDVMDSFLHDQRLWAAASSGRSIQNPTINGVTYGLIDMGNDHDYPVAPPDKVLLSMFKYGESSGIQIHLTFADEKGKVMAQTDSFLNLLAPDPKKEPAPPAPKQEDPKIPVPDAVAMLRQAWGPRGPISTPTTEEVRTKLLRPEQIDPLALTGGPMMVSCAGIEGKNLVAVVGDDLYAGGWWDSKHEPSPAQFLHALRMTTYECAEDGDWLQIRPALPRYERTVRVPRKQLGDFLRTVAKGGSLNVDEQAAFALAMPYADQNGMPTALAGAVSGDQNPITMDINLLRFYGSLTDDQRKQAEGPQGLQLGSLGSEQLEQLYPLVYPSWSNLQYEPTRGPNGEMNMMDDMAQNWWNNIMREPTECMPNGVPPSGVLTITVDNHDAAYPADESLPWWMRQQGMDASSLAWTVYSVARSDLFPWSQQQYNGMIPSTFRYGSQKTYVFDFKFLPQIHLQTVLQETHKNVSEPVALKDLPADFVKKFNEQLDSLKKAYANAEPGQFGGWPSRPMSPP